MELLSLELKYLARATLSSQMIRKPKEHVPSYINTLPKPAHQEECWFWLGQYIAVAEYAMRRFCHPFLACPCIFQLAQRWHSPSKTFQLPSHSSFRFYIYYKHCKNTMSSRWRWKLSGHTLSEPKVDTMHIIRRCWLKLLVQSRT